MSPLVTMSRRRTRRIGITILNPKPHQQSWQGTPCTGKAQRRRGVKRFLIVAIGLLLLLAHATIAASSYPQRAPVNPEFLAYQETLRTMAPKWLRTEEGYALGLVPSPVDLSHVTADPLQKISPLDRLSLPSSYDLRSLGRVTPVKDQGGCGSCWAFATMGSLESWLLTSSAVSWNLSENNLKECHDFAYGPCEGGDRFMSTA